MEFQRVAVGAWRVTGWRVRGRHGRYDGGAGRRAVLSLAQALVLAGLVEVEGAALAREGAVTQGATRRAADALLRARRRVRDEPLPALGATRVLAGLHPPSSPHPGVGHDPAATARWASPPGGSRQRREVGHGTGAAKEMLKRQMYGRAGLPLLRQRMLATAA